MRITLLSIIIMMSGCISFDQNEDVSKLKFDHTYIKIDEKEVFDDLVSRGFTPKEEEAYHPGVHCRFIKLGAEYLEFCQFIDWQAYRARFDPETLTTMKRTDFYRPGLSLKSESQLKLLHQKLNKQGLATEFSHRNYDWQNDELQEYKEKPNRKGWNFLHFQEPLLDTVNFWITEYESTPEREKRKQNYTHANSAQKVSGLVFDRRADLSRLKSLTRVQKNEDYIEFAGQRVYLVDRNEFNGLFKNKWSNYLAVVIKVDSLATFVNQAKPEEFISLAGKKAAVIRMKDSMWDILAVEE